MYCKHYMMTEPTWIVNSAPLADALRIMVRKHMQHLIVVDADHRYVGEISAHRLARFLLPEGVDPAAPQVSLPEGFAERETAEEVDNRLIPHLREPVGSFVDEHFDPVTPDTPIALAILRFQAGVPRLAVVDGDGRLVGALSTLTMLRRFQF